MVQPQHCMSNDVV